MIRYSVVIPVYRVESYLHACIDSVLAQETASDFEILLIDDGSPDRCGLICDEYAERDSRVRVLHIENQGVSHARNLGIQKAKGDYVLFLDSDDVWEPGYFRALDLLTAKVPDMALVGYARLYPDLCRKTFALPVRPGGETGAQYLARVFDANKVPCFYSPCYAFRNCFLMKNNLLFREDLTVSEDFELIMRALSAAVCITGCDQSLYNYRIRTDSATAQISAKKLMDNLITKAAFFRQYPTAAMANLYANNALLITCLGKKDRSAAKAFLKANRDIWHHVSEKPLKLGGFLVRCFGDWGGVAIYDRIRGAVRRLQGRTL